MAKGRYIKAAERACAAKTRYETALDAERASDWRFRAYRCPVCHGFHLTSQPGNRATAPEPPPPAKPKEPGPKLGDLDWSAALDPKPKPARQPKPKKPPRPSPPTLPAQVTAKCAGKPGKDGRVLLVLHHRLVKSTKIESLELRSRLSEGVLVSVSDEDPPVVQSVLEA